MLFLILEQEPEMKSIVEEVKKVLDSTTRCIDLKFRGAAKTTTLGQLDELWKLGCAIRRKRNDLIVTK